MAAASGNQIRKLFQEGTAGELAVYSIRDVTTGDTVDLGPSGTGDFLVLKFATMIGDTVAGALVASVSGTTVTIPAGVSADAIYLTVRGDAAT
jgi:hypothetical protein